MLTAFPCAKVTNPRRIQSAGGALVAGDRGQVLPLPVVLLPGQSVQDGYQSLSKNRTASTIRIRTLEVIAHSA